uniref:Uncharacterized protein AlNc14C4G605 n=1 Tax=Albugo laibachii Nc14 TaxID=890382 RepID=F0W0G2_9STRA|nr:conserved hypothetical protein [Albugo laibachii Nc14]|eukprot:CCA14534.1 conserved hypothetical protein [Albugo laibachii Nc14]
MTTPNDDASLLLHKLEHPLASIRKRAVRRLLSKLETDSIQPEKLQLYNSILHAFSDPEIADDALNLLQLALGKMGCSGMDHISKQKLTQQLQETIDLPSLPFQAKDILNEFRTQLFSVDTKPEHSSQQGIKKRNDGTKHAIGTKEEKAKSVNVKKVIKESQALKSHAGLTFLGWKFPLISLTPADEEYLLEFYTKLKMRTAYKEIVKLLQEFQHALIPNFPAQCFLQNPEILQYVVHLTQLPFIHNRADRDKHVEESCFAFGVNYFDDVESSAFSSRFSESAACVVITSLQVLESWTHSCLSASTWMAVDPSYNCYESSLKASKVSEFDNRRRYFPQVHSAIYSGQSSQSMYSLSGFVFLMFDELLSLVPSKHHPQLQILNLLHACVPLLLHDEAPRSTSTANVVGPQHKLHCQLIFEKIEPVFNLVEASNRISVLWRFVQLIKALLEQFPSQAFRVSKDRSVDHDKNSSIQEERSERIITDCVTLPPLFWYKLTGYVVRHLIPLKPQPKKIDAAIHAELNQLYTVMEKIDGSVKRYRENAESIAHYQSVVARFIRDVQCLNEGEKLSISAYTTLIDQCAHIVHHLHLLNDDEISRVKHGLLRVLSNCCESDFQTECKEESVKYLSQVYRVLLEANLKNAHDDKMQNNVAGQFLEYLSSWLDGPDFAKSVQNSLMLNLLQNTRLTTELLMHLTCECNDGCIILWSIVDKIMQAGVLFAINDDGTRRLHQLVPILQHVAYYELDFNHDQAVIDTVSSTQRNVLKMLSCLEDNLYITERILSLTRKLCHHSQQVRKAAAVKLYEVLEIHGDQHEADSMTKPDFDPFSQCLKNGVTFASVSPALQDGERPTVSWSLMQLCQFRQIIQSQPRGSSIYSHGVREMSNFVGKIPQSQMQYVEQSEDFTEIFIAVGDDIVSYTDNVSLVEDSLQLIFVMLKISAKVRKKARADSKLLHHIARMIFYSEVFITFLVFPIVLVLTCSADILESVEPACEDAFIPCIFAKSFCLHADKWKRLYGLTFCPIRVPTTTKTEELVVLQSQVQAQLDQDLTSEFQMTLSSIAKSSSASAFLNALYHSIQLASSQHFFKQSFVAQWDEIFLKYLQKAPATPKDTVVQAGILVFVDLLSEAMSESSLIHLLTVVKQNVLPTFERISCPQVLQIQILRLLQGFMQENEKLQSLFISAVADTRLLKSLSARLRLCKLSKSSSSFLVLSLEILLYCVRSYQLLSTRKNPITSALAIIRGDLEEVTLILESFISQQRTCGTFQHWSVVVRAARLQYLLLMESPVITAHESQSNVWKMRLMYHSHAPVRSIGFTAASYPHQMDSDDVALVRRGQIVHLAFDTFRDPTECDAVRAKACDVLLIWFIQSLDQAEQSAASVLPTAMNQLMNNTPSSCNRLLDWIVEVLHDEKFLVRTTTSLVRFVRYLLTGEEFANVSTIKLEMLKSIETVHADCQLLTLLIEMLSVRRYRFHFQKWQQQNVGLAPTASRMNANVWKNSVKPSALCLIFEILLFLQALLAQSHSHIIQNILIKCTPLPLELMSLLDKFSSIVIGEALQESQKALYHRLIQATGETLILCMNTASNVLDRPLVNGLLAQELMAPCRRLLNSSHPQGTVLISCQLIAMAIPSAGTKADEWFAQHEPEGIDISSSLLESIKCTMEKIKRAHTSPSSHHQLHKAMTGCLCTILEHFPASRDHLCDEKHAVEWTLKKMRYNFYEVRLLGGFGPQHKSKTEVDTSVWSHCRQLESVSSLLRSLLYKNDEGKIRAKELGLCEILRSNWNVIKSGYCCGSPLLRLCLQLIANYIDGVDDHKASLVSSVKDGSRGVEQDSIFSQLLHLLHWLHPNPTTRSDEELLNLMHILGSVLKAAMLNDECVQVAIKTRFTSTAFSEIHKYFSTKHDAAFKFSAAAGPSYVIQMLQILSNFALKDAASLSICQVLSIDQLREFVSDVLNIESDNDSRIMEAGTLFIRNLLFAKSARSSWMAVWEDAWRHLWDVFCHAHRQQHNPLLHYASSSLWSLLIIGNHSNKVAALAHSDSQLLVRKQLEDVSDAIEAVTTEQFHCQEIVRNVRGIQQLMGKLFPTR